MGDRGSAGQADGLADLPHRRGISPPLNGVTDDFDDPPLPVRETGTVRPDSRRSAGQRTGGLYALRICGCVIHGMHRLESALGAVLGGNGGAVCCGGHVGPSRNVLPSWTTVVAFERLRQTHVRVKIPGSADATISAVYVARIRHPPRDPSRRSATVRPRVVHRSPRDCGGSAHRSHGRADGAPSVSSGGPGSRYLPGSRTLVPGPLAPSAAGPPIPRPPRHARPSRSVREPHM